MAVLIAALPSWAESGDDLLLESTGPFDTQVIVDCAGLEPAGAVNTDGRRPLFCNASSDLDVQIPAPTASHSASVTSDGLMSAGVKVSGGTPAASVVANTWVHASTSWTVNGEFRSLRFVDEFTSNVPFYGFDFQPLVQTTDDLADSLGQPRPLERYSDFADGGTGGEVGAGICSDGSSPQFEPTYAFGPAGDGSTRLEGLHVYCADPNAHMGSATQPTTLRTGLNTSAFARSTYLTSYDVEATGHLLKTSVLVER